MTIEEEDSYVWMSSLHLIGAGQSITIVVGGAAESLSAHPGTAGPSLLLVILLYIYNFSPDLTLRKRLGFIKVAIQHGSVLGMERFRSIDLPISRADLVPVFAFGENDVSILIICT